MGARGVAERAGHAGRRWGAGRAQQATGAWDQEAGGLTGGMGAWRSACGKLRLRGAGRHRRAAGRHVAWQGARPGRAAGPVGCALGALSLFLARFDSVLFLSRFLDIVREPGS